MSFVSVIGIALGVAILITVLSVMNGFDEAIHEKLFNMAPQVLVSSPSEPLTNWRELSAELATLPEVIATAPLISGKGLINQHGQVTPVMVSGIIPSREQQISALAEKMTEGTLAALQPKGYGVIIGRGIADELGLFVGSRLTLLIPESTVSPLGVMPKFKRFTVEGIFDTGSGFGFSNRFIFIHLNDAQKLYRSGDGVTDIRLKLSDVYHAPNLAQFILNKYDYRYIVSDWTTQYGGFLQMVKMEKSMMFYILLLIVVVAIFNLISSLVMIVNDKRTDIAVLKTLGMGNFSVQLIFIKQGFFIGMIGSALGLLGGLILTYNAQAILDFIQHLSGTQVMASGVYIVDELPTQLLMSDVISIVLIAMLLSLVATLYPARRATKVLPAEALRYE